MACDKETLLLLSCYVDGEVTPEDATRAVEHINTCADCRKLVAEWQSQRHLLKWACTLELPDVVGVDIPKWEKDVDAVRSTLRRPNWLHWRWNWAIVGAVILISLVTYHFMILPPIFGVGKTLTVGSRPEVVRMEGGISLEVGPNSKISRINNRYVKLERGWMSASVRHGTDFHVIMPRMHVSDIGTRFWVGTGPQIDCVTVDEGSVSVESGGITREVRAGEISIARDGEKLSLLSLPVDKMQPETDEVRLLLKEYDAEFVPSSGDRLDFIEGLHRLAIRFPKALIGGGSVSGAGENRSRRNRFTLSCAPGLRKALRAHFQEIARGLAGGSLDNAWEIPVGYVMVYGVMGQIELPDDVYYLRMVSTNGRIVWRLNGSKGADVDFPVVLTNKNSLTCGNGMSGSDLNPLKYGLDTKNPVTPTLKILLSDWPGDSKPALCLEIKTVAISDVRYTDQTILDQVERVTSSINGFVIPNSIPDIEYLDADRKHRLLIEWNQKSGAELHRLIDNAKQGHGGSALLGVMATDADLLIPNTKAGVYLIKLVLPNASRSSYIELVALGGKKWSLRDLGKPSDSGGGNSGWSPNDYDSVKLGYGWRRSDKRSFWFRFMVSSEPNDPISRMLFKDGSASDRGNPYINLAEGWIRINKP